VAELREDIVVVGGGAIGVCCAEALARTGRSVLLLERGELGAGSSRGNAGLLTTSSAAPEAAPGVMRQATRWMLDRDGPFRFRPRLDAKLASWLWRFRAHCTPAAAAAATSFLRELVLQDIRLVEAQAGESSHDFSLRTNGLIAVFDSEQGLTEGLAGAAALGELGVPSEALGRDRLLQLEPRVTERIVGGILYPEDAHLDPLEYVRAVAGMAERRGARIREHTPVVRLQGTHGVEVVETDAATIRPELVVLAGGAWTPSLLPSGSRRLLVEPGKGFSVTYDAGATVFERPLRLGEIRTIVRSVGDSVRVTSKLDLVGLDEGISERRGRSGVTRSARYVDLPPGDAAAPVWTGLRPLAPDGLPYVGRLPAAPNVVVASGHGHLGISLAAVTGEAVAAIVSHGEAPFDLERVRPERFASRRHAKACGKIHSHTRRRDGAVNKSV
jgi:D-amino-acid dehydrogenase